MATSGVSGDHKLVAAGKAFQRNFFRLLEALVSDNVPEHLYSNGLIDFDTWEKCGMSTLTTKQKRNAIAPAVRSAIRSNPEALETLCSILDSQPSENTRKISKEVKGELNFQGGRWCLLKT